MAVRAILTYPDPQLRQQAAPVTDFGADVADLVTDLSDTLAAGEGIGLSATQIGEHRQVFVMDLTERTEPPEVYINPEILTKSAWGIVEESCLSVPGVKGNVFRCTQARVRAQDAEGNVFERDLDGMHAVCLQHEMDHLAGKLFIDRLSIFRRIGLKMRGYGKQAAATRAA